MAMTCYTDWKYVRAGDFAKAKALLKYFQYRDDRDNHIPRAGGADRWIDCGLGSSWREILNGAAELQSQQVLLRSLIIRPPQAVIDQLKEVDPERWAGRRELLAELVDRVMDAEMDKADLDLPYAYVIHAPDDKEGVESLHAHVIAPAMDRDRLRPFNIYPQDVQHTREVAERELERLFELDRVRERQSEHEAGLEPSSLEREIDFFEFHER